MAPPGISYCGEGIRESCCGHRLLTGEGRTSPVVAAGSGRPPEPGNALGGRLDGVIHAVWIAVFFVSSLGVRVRCVFALSCPIRDQKLL